MKWAKTYLGVKMPTIMSARSRNTTRPKGTSWDIHVCTFISSRNESLKIFYEYEQAKLDSNLQEKAVRVVWNEAT